MLGVAILSAICSGHALATITLTFSDNLTPLDPYPSTGTFLGTYEDPMGAGKEYRMIAPSNAVGGGGEKTILNGGEQWIFDDDINLTSVVNTEETGGAGFPGSAAPAGDIGLHQNAPFFGAPFGFLAPTVGSLAAEAYGGPGIINIDAANNILTVIYNVAEAQWGGTWFPLGLIDDGAHGDKITFKGPITNIESAGGITTFDFVITAEHIIQRPEEDPGEAGFTDWTAQWEMPGSGSAPDEIFFAPDSPSSDTGNLNPTPGGPADGNDFDDGRMTLAEAETTPCGVDADMSAACVGSCFDYTVTNIDFSPVQVVLPLTTAIPANAVLRKCDGVNWRDFDESGGDTVESAPGASGDCSAPGPYAPGLVQGYFCVRTTIENGGINDLDGNALDRQIVDPVGVAIAPAGGGGGNLIEGEDLGGVGCSMVKTGNTTIYHLEYLLLAGFVFWLGWRRQSMNL